MRFIKKNQHHLDKNAYRFIHSFKKLGIVLVCFCLTLSSLNAQEESKNPFRAFLLNVNYGFHTPGGDLKDRFGVHSTFGGGVEYIHKGYFVGFEGDFLFGGNVKTDVLASLRTPEGFIIGDDLEPATVRLSERGFYLGSNIGRVFPILPNNPRSGIRLSLGAGFLNHKIQIDDDAGNAVQISGEYKKGYDRLTNGFALRQFIGFHHFSRNKLINFYAGFEVTEGFTKNKRVFNFDTMESETESRTDMYFGIKIGWSLPIFIGDSDEYYY